MHKNTAPSPTQSTITPSASMKRKTARFGSRKIALGLLFSSLTFGLVAHAAFSSIGKGNVQFLAVGPAGLKIEGKTSKLTVSESGGELAIKVDLKSLSTGISMRDKHLYKALNANSHPQAILKVKRSDLKIPANDKTVETSAKGILTVNGTAKPTTFQYKATRTGSDYHIQGKVKIDITKHKMEIPCYLGVCVNKDIKVKLQFKLREK